MCNDDIREEVLRLKSVLGMKNNRLVELIRRRYRYPLSETEMSSYLKGTLTTPKAKRVMIDALNILVKEHEKVEQMMERAKNV